MDGLPLLFRRISRHGLLGTIKLIPVNVSWAWRQLKPSNLAERRRERALDRELGIDTARIMTKGALQAETGTAAQITFYQPVPLKIFEEMLGCLPPDLSSFTFIDIGSGKGRALVLAARHGFRDVIGIELSPSLHRVAEKNLLRLRDSLKTTVRALNMDARLFEFPLSPTVIFLGNPFGEEITREVVNNIERVHCNSDLPVFLLYHWPVQRQVFEASDMWEELSCGGWRRDFGFEWRDYVLVRR
jgi:SAM-dependent methyltransferase